MRKYNPAEEKKVLGLLAEGNEFAFTLLFDHYRNGIYTVAVNLLKSRQLAEEIVQEVFLKVWSKREDLIYIENFEGYLFTIARNLVFDFLKDIAKETTRKKDFVANVESAIAADQSLIEEQYNQLLQEALKQLPPQQKQIFRMARVEGLSHQAIAEQLNISRLTVKTHMAKALQTIRQNLQHHIISISVMAIIPAF